MAQAPIMPLMTDALLGDTLHLTAEEFGAYLLLLIATWRNNGAALPNDDVRLARISRCGSNRWSTRIKPRLLEFFDISDGYLHQKRLETTWQFVKKTREKQSAKGKRSAELRALKNQETASTAVPTERQPPNPNPFFLSSDSSNPQKEIRSPRLNGAGELVRSLDAEFDEIWEIFPRKVGKLAAQRAYRAARKRASFDLILSAVRQHAIECQGVEPRFVPHPATWLNQGRWMDEATAANSHANGHTELTEEERNERWARVAAEVSEREAQRDAERIRRIREKRESERARLNGIEL